MIYADWDFYTTSYLHGDTPTLTETNFERWASRAIEHIDMVTKFSGKKFVMSSLADLYGKWFHFEYDNKMFAVPEFIAMATCALAEHFFLHNRNFNRQTEAIAYKYLSGTGLLSHDAG
jgi:hypothetical protein